MTDRDYDSPERKAVRDATADMVDEARRAEQAAPRPGAITTKVEEIKAAAADALYGDEPEETKPYRLTNEALLRALLKDAGDWREQHDREANDRHGAIMGAVVSYQAETRAEIASVKAEVAALRATGIPREGLDLIKNAVLPAMRRTVPLLYVVAVCAVLGVFVAAATLAFRVYAFEHDEAAIIRALSR